MLCHNNKSFLICLPKRCSRSRLKKGGSGSRLRLIKKNWLRLHPKKGGSRRLQLRNTSGGTAASLPYLMFPGLVVSLHDYLMFPDLACLAWWQDPVLSHSLVAALPPPPPPPAPCGHCWAGTRGGPRWTSQTSPRTCSGEGRYKVSRSDVL